MTTPRVAVIGAGWSGATCARVLSDAGIPVQIFEANNGIGGHSRVETLCGVVYEPNGAHIFHTSDAEVAAFVGRFGLSRPYEHTVLSEAYLDDDDDEPRLFTWPLQVDELRELAIWPQVERELAELPDAPQGDDFESWVVSLMGPTLYHIFVEDYTRKQWGVDPSELSARFAPKRVDLRRDGNRRMFRDTWEFFHPTGVNEIVESVVSTSAVTCGASMGIGDLDDLLQSYSDVVITAPLDAFTGHVTPLEWRGVQLLSRVVPTDEPDGTATEAYVVNRPSARVPYTRTVETKHATGQLVGATVVSEEYPGSSDRHYPVATVDGRNQRANQELARAIVDRCPPGSVHLVGRLAEYLYINQDEAIRRGIDCAQRILAAH